MNYPEGVRNQPLHSLGRIEFLALACLLFFLPLLEAPKNLLWLAFLVIWLGRAQFTSAGWGGSWRTERDLPFVLLLSAATFSCILAPPFPQRWAEVGDVLRYVLFAWLVSRSLLSKRQLFTALFASMAGTMVAAAQGWWRWQMAGETSLFELHSVGHVNHSLIYLAIISLGTLGALATLWFHLQFIWRASLLLVLAAQCWLLLTGESRGAMITYAVGASALLWIAAPRTNRKLLLAFAVLAIGIILTTNQFLIDKTIRLALNPAAGGISSYRIELATTALEVARENPVAGIGPGNFIHANAEQISSWLLSRGEAYDPEKHYHSSHAHNLYLNTLAERGLFGGLALVYLMITWFRLLKNARPGKGSALPSAAFVWSISFAGFIGVFVAGLFNTTLHHEHGLLAMFAFALLAAERSKQ